MIQVFGTLKGRAVAGHIQCMTLPDVEASGQSKRDTGHQHYRPQVEHWPLSAGIAGGKQDRPGNRDQQAGCHIGKPVRAKVEAGKYHGGHKCQQHQANRNPPRWPQLAGEQETEKSVEHGIDRGMTTGKRKRAPARIKIGNRPGPLGKNLDRSVQQGSATDGCTQINRSRPSPLRAQPGDERQRDASDHKRVAQFRNCHHQRVCCRSAQMLQRIKNRLVGTDHRSGSAYISNNADGQADAGQPNQQPTMPQNRIFRRNLVGSWRVHHETFVVRRPELGELVTVSHSTPAFRFCSTGLRMKVLVLVNSGAGPRAAKGAGRAAQIHDAFARCGVEAKINLTAGTEISRAARAVLDGRHSAAGSGFDALVVAGGDGTVSAAAAELAGSDMPLGILPFGTLNHFARDLGLPNDLAGAVAAIAARNIRQVDVAELNGRVFVNNSSIGFYPFLVASRNDGQARFGLSKILATIPALARTLSGAVWHHLDIAFAGQRARVRTPCVFVGNNTYATDLDRFGTRDRLDSGLLSVFVVRQQTRLGLMLLPFKIAMKLADRVRDIETFSVADLAIYTRRARLRVAMDGEIAMFDSPLRYRSRPAALAVLAPEPPGDTH